MWTSILLILMVSGLVYELATAGQSRKHIENGRKTKLAVYQQTMVFLCFPTIVLFIAIYTGEINTTKWGLIPEYETGFFIGVTLILAVIVYFLLSFNSIKKSEKLLTSTKESFTDLAWIMPKAKSERNWFVLGVSVAAGVCEELLFRGFLLNYLQSFMNLPLAVIVSSACFGLFHAYQGWNNVLRTGAVGLVLALIYIFTGTIWLVIILHFLLDAYAGQLHYMASNKAPAIAENKT